jgi:hypothetical protein
MPDDVSIFMNSLNPDEVYATCKNQAQTEGALAQIQKYCYAVYGKEIPIGDDEASVQQGAEITNWNFRTSSSGNAIPDPRYAPGPVKGAGNVTLEKRTNVIT